MKSKNRIKTRRLGAFLAQAMPFMILFMVIAFGLTVTHFQAQNRLLLERSRRAAENSEAIIRKLEQVVDDIKRDNQQNTAYLNCLLAAHDLGQFDTTICIAAADAIHDSTPQSTPAPQPSPSPNTGGAGTSQPFSPSQSPPPPVDEGILDDDFPILGGLL